MNTTSLSLRLSQLAVVAALSATGVAHAGECPADQVATNALAGAPSAPVGVTDTELA